MLWLKLIYVCKRDPDDIIQSGWSDFVRLLALSSRAEMYVFLYSYEGQNLK